MPVYVITGTKVLKDGAVQTIRETAPSRTKAEWAAAHYVAGGFKVTINEQEK